MIREAEENGLPGFKAEPGAKVHTYQPGDEEGKKEAYRRAEEQLRAIKEKENG